MKLLKIIKRKLGDKIKESFIIRDNNVSIKIDCKNLKETINTMVNLSSFSHIITIVGIDIRSAIELNYFFFFKDNGSISIKVDISKVNPVVESIVKIIPGAILYEREIYDLLGIKFLNHPQLNHLLLPDDWPEDLFPLRKENKI